VSDHSLAEEVTYPISTSIPELPVNRNFKVNCLDWDPTAPVLTYLPPADYFLLRPQLITRTGQATVS
jgi:hypothetical protein